MDSAYHAGERAVQERAGVRDRAARIAGSIHRVVPAAARGFLQQRTFVVLATADAAGRPWVSLLSGPPGFAGAPQPRTVRLEAVPLPGDPLAENLQTSDWIGLLAIDPATRRRMRVNGRVLRTGHGVIEIATDQVYANCPKYIQRRGVDGSPAAARMVHRSSTPSAEQGEWIRRADTFFVATVVPGAGADASHRGGMPGFVTVEGNRLSWPDYAGNLMFNTLGNIASHPRAGLLFPDFETGAILQLTGRAAIDWDSARAARVPGAERLVDVEVEEVVETAGALPRSIGAPEYSPFNPAAAP